MTDLLTEAAVELIEQYDASSKPMFLLLSHLAPHGANIYDDMQAPDDEVEKFEYIKNEKEKYYAAMVSRVDRSVGQVIDALAQQQMLQHSIVLFLSDNGGPTVGMHSTTASNYPLRGVSKSMRFLGELLQHQFHHLFSSKRTRRGREAYAVRLPFGARSSSAWAVSGSSVFT